jgi:hypothetical protein
MGGRQISSEAKPRVFDIMVFYFSNEDTRLRSLKRRERVVEAYKRLCANTEFVRTLEATTKSITATQFRLAAWGEALSGVVESAIHIPQIGVE